MSAGQVAIVVPLTAQPLLTADEETSLRHLVHFLGGYDKYFIAPKGTRLVRSGFQTMTFPERYFGSAKAHARLQLSEEFYSRFLDYQYILMYHLDALVFSDQLKQWCATDVDYIGAPWLQCSDSPWVSHPRVGNGGFSLMKVSSFLNVMRSRRQAVDVDEYWKDFCATRSRLNQWLNLPRKYLKRLRVFNSVKWEMRRWPNRPGGAGNSDYFWSDRAVKYAPGFKVASVDTALKFAFEVSPRWCFERTSHQLPFGCHAWPRYDRGFWEPYLLK